jgi:hypothetical protein
MKSFILGTVLGIAVGTVGFNGLAPILDNGVRFIQNQTINAVQTNNSNNFHHNK